MKDKKRIDKLQALTHGYGKGWICRESSNGRGLRLHETTLEGAFPTIREAIDDFLQKQENITEEIESPKVIITIPVNLQDSFGILKNLLHETSLEQFKNWDEDTALAQTHHGLGQWIRNNWGLWTGESEIASWFHNNGISHGDDMSGVILTSFHRHLNNRELKVEEQFEVYKEFWKKHKS